MGSQQSAPSPGPSQPSLAALRSLPDTPRNLDSLSSAGADLLPDEDEEEIWLPPDWRPLTGMEKLQERAFREPFVLAGTALTIYAFIQASRALRVRDSAKMQKYMRYRVGFQAVTVAGMFIGAQWFAAARKKEKDMEDLYYEQNGLEKPKVWVPPSSPYAYLYKDDMQKQREEIAASRSIKSSRRERPEKRNEEEVPKD